jgi:hypothetical protein
LFRQLQLSSDLLRAPRAPGADAAFCQDLATAAPGSVGHARYRKVCAVARCAGAVDCDIDVFAASRPLDRSLSSRSANLVGRHLKRSISTERTVQPRDVQCSIPCHKADQLVVWFDGDVPIEPRAAANRGTRMIGVQLSLFWLRHTRACCNQRRERNHDDLTVESHLDFPPI